ncbi:hypothetical protein [Escherichia phage IMM-001]|nr:hypothetical protein [Escherichia phage IMM-001]
MEFSDYIVYDNGKLRWKKKTGRSTQIGKEIGINSGSGYLTFKFYGKRYKVHRVVWMIMVGPIPDGMETDHINHVRDDNRIENLRLVSRIENMKNKSVYRSNSSGFCGVSVKSSGMYHAYIQFNGKQVNLGLFKEKQDAVTARLEAEMVYGFHDNHGL